MRTFVSIDISGSVAEKIREMQEKLPEFRGKPTEVGNLHLTLKFLGEINEEMLEKVKSRLKTVDFKKFPVVIDSIGVFDPEFVKIIWLRINDCTPLQKEIDKALEGLFPEEQRFMSHLTIARVRNIVGDKKVFLNKIQNMKIEPMKLVVGGFELKQSVLTPNGPQYKTLETYYLE